MGRSDEGLYQSPSGGAAESDPNSDAKSVVFAKKKSITIEDSDESQCVPVWVRFGLESEPDLACVRAFLSKKERKEKKRETYATR